MGQFTRDITQGQTQQGFYNITTEKTFFFISLLRLVRTEIPYWVLNTKSQHLDVPQHHVRNLPTYTNHCALQCSISGFKNVAKSRTLISLYEQQFPAGLCGQYRPSRLDYSLIGPQLGSQYSSLKLLYNRSKRVP